MALPVNFDADSAGRIFRAVRTVERGNRDQKPLTFKRVIEQNPRVFRLGRFSGPWATNTFKTITLEGAAATLSVLNLFYPITASVSNKPCAVAKNNGTWLLLSVPFQTATAVGVSGTATILRITPSDTATALAVSLSGTATALIFSLGSTATASVISGSVQSKTFVTGVSASLNTTDCNIVVTVSTGTVGHHNTATIEYVSTGSTSLITFFSSSATSQIVSISTSATATAAVVESTQVLSFLRFED